MKSAIYVYPEPNHGFVRLDCITEALATEAVSKEQQGNCEGARDIPPRVVLRVLAGQQRSDVVLDCASYEEACERVNTIRALVEEYHAASIQPASI
jgi:hypothetical protein